MIENKINKITIFNGSPRTTRSNTHFMVKEFTKGAENAGASVDNVFLAKKNIGYCQGCFLCWTHTPGKCSHKNNKKDDMEGLITKYMSSDLVVFATPLYVDGVSAQMKTFMDRLIPTVNPYFEKDSNGEYCHEKRYSKYPKMAVISNAGLPEQSQFQALDLHFKRAARNLRSELVATIYRGSGELFSSDSLIVKPFIWFYQTMLKQAGKEIVRNGEISEATQKRLEKTLLTPELYIGVANRYFKSALEKLHKKY